MRGSLFISNVGLLLPLMMVGAASTAPVVPDAAEQIKAQRLIRSVYKEDYARTGSADRRILAGKLLRQAKETRDNPAAQHVLLNEACTLATAAGDAHTALRAVEALAEYSPQKAGEMRLSALTAISHAVTTPEMLEVFIDEAQTAIGKAMGVDDFDVARRLVGLSESVLARFKRPALTAQVRGKSREVALLAEEYKAVQSAVETLRQKPNDRPSRQRVGRYRCLLKGDWEGGLPFLADGEETPFSIPAVRDLARPVVATSRAELAGQWWDLSETQPQPMRRHLQNRAAFWYRQALPGLSGLTRSLGEQRLQQVETQFITDMHLEAGLRAELFRDENFTQQVKTRIDPQIDFDWGTGAADEAMPKDNFSIRWSGLVKISQSDFHTFIVIANQGARLMVDGQLLIDAPNLSRKRKGQRATLKLEEGLHRLQLEFWDGGGAARAKLLWLAPGVTEPQPIPAAVFFHNKVAD